MNREEFLDELQNILQREDILTPDMKFADIPEWDSLTLLSVSLFINSKFNIVLNFNQVKELVVVEDLLKRVGL